MLSRTRWGLRTQGGYRVALRGRNINTVLGTLNSFLRGWRSYYEFSMGKKLIHELNAWMVRRLKAFLWNQWRLPRTKVKKLKQLGLGHEDAMLLGNTRKGASVERQR